MTEDTKKQNLDEEKNKKQTETDAGLSEQDLEGRLSNEDSANESELEDIQEAEIHHLNNNSKFETEIQDLNNRYLRSVADYENYRRRVEKEKQDLLKYGNEKLIADILPALDSLDKAILDSEKSNLANEEGYKQMIAGIQLVRDQLIKTLESKGLKRIHSLNQVFNPELHQAIQKVEKEGIEHETVIEEFMVGYELNGRLVRAAMVAVAVPK